MPHLTLLQRVGADGRREGRLTLADADAPAPQPQARPEDERRRKRQLLRAFGGGLEGLSQPELRQQIGRPLTKGEVALGFLGSILQGSAIGAASAGQPLPATAGGGTFFPSFGRGFGATQNLRAEQALLRQQRQRQALADAVALAREEREQSRFEREEREDPIVSTFEGQDEKGPGRFGVTKSGKAIRLGAVAPEEEKGASPIFLPAPELEGSEQEFLLFPSGERRPTFRFEGPPEALQRKPVTRPKFDRTPKPRLATVRDRSGVERTVFLDENEDSPTFGQIIRETDVERQPRPQKPSASDKRAKQDAQVEQAAAFALQQAENDPDRAIELVNRADMDDAAKSRVRQRIRERSRPGQGKKGARERLNQLLNPAPQFPVPPALQQQPR